MCFHCRGTSSYHTTNTLQGRRAKSHVDTQTIQPRLGTSYSRPPIDPYLTPHCHKTLAAPVVRDTAKPAVKRRYNKKAATTLSAAVDSISAVLVHSCSKCCSPVARTASDRRSRLSPARHQARTRRLHQSHVTRTRLNCASEPAA